MPQKIVKPRSQTSDTADSTSQSISSCDNQISHDHSQSDSTKASSDVLLSPPTESVTALVILSVLLYCSISISIVYFNWWLFTGAFQYPVFVSWIQQVVGLGVFTCLGFLGRFFPLFSHFPSGIPEWAVFQHVFLVSLTFSISVGLSNLCLQFVQISTYQVARGLTLIFTLMLSYIVLGESQRFPAIASSGFMVAGFIIASLDGATLSLPGVLAGGFSSSFQAFYNVTVKRVLPYTDNNPNLLLYHNLWWSSVLFIPLIFICREASVLSILRFNPFKRDFYIQWGSLLVSGILSTSMNSASYWCIRITSPLTFNVVGLTKATLQSIGGIILLGDLVTLQSITGLALSLTGSAWYSWNKAHESKPEGKLPIYDDSPKELQNSERAGTPKNSFQRGKLILEEELELIKNRRVYGYDGIGLPVESLYDSDDGTA